jgi:hypothetical protein
MSLKRSVKMKNLGKLYDEELSYFEKLCCQVIRTMGIVSVVIVVSWGVYKLLAHTFGGI